MRTKVTAELKQETGPQTDGRINRSTRTRAKIVDALFELVQAGNLIPTSEEVAAQAQVGLRTVFRHFEDMESLYQEVDLIIRSRFMPSLGEQNATGSLEKRLSETLERRADVFAKIQNFVHSTEARKWRSPFLEKGLGEFAGLQRNLLELAIPEITKLDPARQQAIDILASFQAWDRAVNIQGLNASDALDLQKSGILSLLGETR